MMGNNNRVFFSNKIEKGNNITLYDTRVSFTKARVDFFTTDYSLPPPPFSDRSPLPYPSIPDSTFYVSSYDGHSMPLTINKRGVYFIRLDSSANVTGCTVMGVEQNFPKVLSHTQMIAATRFIMNKDEYQKMINAKDKQAAIDNFWLTLGGGEDRAKELIKRYYNRVQDANTFFTSHTEGWKTDMGMIYIVFGPPNKTYKTQQMETWVYGNEGTPNSATFRFEKINNPFSENNFKLIRNVSYRDPWYIAVNNWRDGHVYLEAK
jgi:GWxTD domain-containing protein